MPLTRGELAEELLEIFSDRRLFCGAHDRDEGLPISVNCNDVFYLGTADLEMILEEDLPAVQQAFDDLDAYGKQVFCFILFAARKRGLRPHKLWLERVLANAPEVRKLFEAVGAQGAR